MVIFADIMGHKVITVLILAFLLSHETNGREKDPDEDKAYEFGFTIEGMQHRHEKKDVNGIIQGEFGFITADGVYHVTVYATDENGNFRIISMKNIKVSPPLDGSPDFGSTKYSPIPKGPQSQISSSGSTTLKPVQVQKRTQEQSTKAPVRAFTTKPTLKPACAGCGYVTTSKTPSVFPNSNGGITGGTNGLSAKVDVNDNRNTSPLLNRFSSNGQQNRVDSFNTNDRNPNGAGNNAQSGGIPNKQDFSTQNKYDLQQNNKNSPNLSDRFGGPLGDKQQTGFPDRPSSYSDSFSNPPSEKNGIPGPPKQVQHSSSITHRNPEPPVKVSNGVIQIPGNPDIAIKDKYPGMVDGLPPGIEEKDITDILYRFNWTVGFQGHYETGYRNGAKIGGYFVNGSDGISRVVTYVADEFGYRPKVRIINIGLDSPKTPKDDKTFKLESFEFVWYPVK